MRINWYSNIGQGQGYSGSSEQLAIALDNRPDTDLTVVGFKTGQSHKKNISYAGRRLMQKEFRLADVGVAHGFPNAASSLAMNKFKVLYTMFETDTLPGPRNTWTGPYDTASKSINSQVDMLLTPAHWNIGMFRDNGVTVPIEVVPNGINPKHFSYIDRPKRDTFTFLILGTLTVRKNPGAVISAFATLFKDRPNVRLIIKTQSGTLGHLVELRDMGNIQIIDKLSDLKEVQQLYEQADCFVFPSRGEGFGMPPVEAMATGLPTIMSNHTGMTEYADDRFNYPIRLSHKTPAVNFPKDWGYVGNWYEPDFEHFKALMWYVYMHQDEARAKGKLASEFVLREFNYDSIADKTVKAIQKHYNQG